MSHINGIAVLALAATLALASGGAAAQSEDEQILQQDRSQTGGTDLPPPAPTEEEELDEQVFYSGLGVGRADSGFSNLGEAVNLEAVIGFRIPTVKWFGIEVDIGQTIIPGENMTAESGGPPICISDPIPVIDPDGTPDGCVPAGNGEQQTNTRDRDEFGMQALGLSAVLKSTGRFYVMGRYGYRYLATSIDELNVSRSGTGFGVGAGYRWGKGLSGVELTYKELSDQVDQIGLVFFARMGRR